MVCNKTSNGIVCTSDHTTQVIVDGELIEIDFHPMWGPSFSAYRPVCSLKLKQMGYSFLDMLCQPVHYPTENMWNAFNSWVQTLDGSISQPSPVLKITPKDLWEMLEPDLHKLAREIIDLAINLQDVLTDDELWAYFEEAATTLDVPLSVLVSEVLSEC